MDGTAPEMESEEADHEEEEEEEEEERGYVGSGAQPPHGCTGPTSPNTSPKQPLATRPPIRHHHHHRPYTPLLLLRSAAPTRPARRSLAFM
jgi:hypothetical protein